MTTDKTPSTLTHRGLIPYLVVVIGAMIVATGSGFQAQSSLLIHEARQNGTLETIRDHMEHQDTSIDKLDAKMEKMAEKATQRQAEIIQLLTESVPTN